MKPEETDILIPLISINDWVAKELSRGDKKSAQTLLDEVLYDPQENPTWVLDPDEDFTVLDFPALTYQGRMPINVIFRGAFNIVEAEVFKNSDGKNLARYEDRFF